MLTRSFVMLFSMVCCSLLSFGTPNPGGHGGGHGGHGGGHGGHSGGHGGHGGGHSHGGGHARSGGHSYGGRNLARRGGGRMRRNHYHNYSSHEHNIRVYDQPRVVRFGFWPYRHGFGGGYMGGYNGGGGLHPINALRYDLAGRQEVSFSAGFLSQRQARDATVAFASPACFFTYKYFITNGLSVGLTAGVQVQQGNGIYQNNYFQPMPFDYTQLNMSIAAEMNWLYCSGRNFQLYGGAGAGFTHWREHDRDYDNTQYTEGGNEFAWQLTPIAFRVGGDLGVFAELGYGYKGVFNAGISYRLGRVVMHGN